MAEPSSPSLTSPMIGSISSYSNSNIDQCNVFVKYLPSSITDSSLFELFKPFGSVLSSKVMINHQSGESLGYGFVRFEMSADASAAIRGMDGYKILGKTLLCKVSNTAPSPSLPTLPSTNLYIKPLSVTTTEAELSSIFSLYGKILEVKVMVDKSTGQSRGIGFVRFETQAQAAAAAAAMDQTRLAEGSHLLTVKYAETKEQKSNRKSRGDGDSPASSPKLDSRRGSVGSFRTDSPAGSPHVGATHASRKKRPSQDKTCFQAAPLVGATPSLLPSPFMAPSAAGHIGLPHAVYYGSPSLLSGAGVPPAGDNVAYVLCSPQAGQPPLMYPVALPLRSPIGVTPVYVVHPQHSHSLPQMPPTLSLSGQSPVPSPVIASAPSSLQAALHHLSLEAETAYSGESAHAPQAPDKGAKPNGPAGALPALLPQPPPRIYTPASPQLYSYIPFPGSPVLPAHHTLQLPPTSPSVAAVHLPPSPALSAAHGLASPAMSPSMGADPEPSNLFCFHLPAEMDSGGLYRLFSPYGPLQSVRVIADKANGVSKGYGFVKFYRKSDAERARSAMNGFRIANKHLKVEFKADMAMSKADAAAFRDAPEGVSQA